MDAYAATDQLMSESFHCPAQRYDGDAVVALEPALRPGLAGGWFYHDDAHLRPDKLLASWRQGPRGVGRARSARTAASAAFAARKAGPSPPTPRRRASRPTPSSSPPAPGRRS